MVREQRLVLWTLLCLLGVGLCALPSVRAATEAAEPANAASSAPPETAGVEEDGAAQDATAAEDAVDEAARMLEEEKARRAGTKDGYVPAGHIVVCPVEGMIDDGVAILIERAIQEAAGAKALILDMDTPGGRVDSCLKITDAIVKAPCHTIAFLDGQFGGISAGAIISFACDDIIMSETARIGASAPVVPTAQGNLPTGEKEVSFLRATVATLAEANGHNPDIGRAMVDKDIELMAFPQNNGTYLVMARDKLGRPGAPDAPPEQRDELTEAIDGFADELPESMQEPVREIGRELARTVREKVQDFGEDSEPERPDDPNAGFVIVPRGKLLTLSPSEARDYGLTTAAAGSIAEVRAFFGYDDDELREIKPTWSEDLYRWLTSPLVSSILLLLGIGGLYFEVKTPGFGVPGIIALICFALFFGARAVIGMAEWLDIALLLLGVGLIALEVFVLPGFGVAGILGFVCVLAGLYLSLTYTDFSIPQYEWEFDRLEDAGKLLLLTVAAMPFLVLAIAKTLPYTPVYREMVLAGTQLEEKGYIVQSAEMEQNMLGQRGVALSTLRPVGRARLAGKTYHVMSLSDYIAAGTPVEVVRVEGNRYVVDEVRDGGNGKNTGKEHA